MVPLVQVRKTVRGSIPLLPYHELTEYVLGKTYELSIVVCGDRLSRKLNKNHRKKTYAANVLSFPLAHGEGEIFLNIRCAAREANRYKISLRSRSALLFVHGLFHLKGLQHGNIMEREEASVLKKFRLL